MSLWRLNQAWLRFVSHSDANSASVILTKDKQGWSFEGRFEKKVRSLIFLRRLNQVWLRSVSHGDANSASVLYSLKTSRAALTKGGLRKEEGGGRVYVQGSDG